MRHPLRVLWLFALAGVIVGGALGWSRRDSVARPTFADDRPSSAQPAQTPGEDEPQAASGGTGTDRTADLQNENPAADWLSLVVSATAGSDGMVRVATVIPADGGSDDRLAARQGIAVCDAAVAMMGRDKPSLHVTVTRADGTELAAYGLRMGPPGCVAL